MDCLCHEVGSGKGEKEQFLRKESIMKKSVMIILALSTAISGCITLTKQGTTVRVVNNVEVIRDCKYISQVESSSSWGGLASGVAFDNAMNEMKNKTASMGGDTVYTTTMLSSWGGTRMIGDAYNCAER
jgi:hypothetical protein